MKLKIKSDGSWTNTFAYLDDIDISDRIEALTIHILVGNLSSIHVRIKHIEEPLLLYSPNFELEISAAESIPE